MNWCQRGLLWNKNHTVTRSCTFFFFYNSSSQDCKVWGREKSRSGSCHSARISENIFTIYLFIYCNKVKVKDLYLHLNIHLAVIFNISLGQSSFNCCRNGVTFNSSRVTQSTLHEVIWFFLSEINLLFKFSFKSTLSLDCNYKDQILLYELQGVGIWILFYNRCIMSIYPLCRLDWILYMIIHSKS